MFLHLELLKQVIMSKQILIGLFPLFVFCTYFKLTSTEMPKRETLEANEVATVSDTIKETKDSINDEFLNELAHLESKNKWKIVSRNGHIGKYQMSTLALKEIGMHKEVSATKFRKNPHIFNEVMQDSAQIELLKINWSYLGKLKSKIGKHINGILITKSGILAACHLVGVGNVRKYLISNGSIIPKDGNGISLERYLRKFKAFSLEL